MRFLILLLFFLIPLNTFSAASEEYWDARSLDPSTTFGPTTKALAIRNIGNERVDLASGKFSARKAVQFAGVNLAVGTSFEDVWDVGGTYTFPQAAETLQIKAGGDAGDDASGAGCQSVLLSGLDGNFLEITEVVATNGTSASTATTQTFIRLATAVCTAVGTYSGANTAAIDIENTSSSVTLARIDIGNSKSQNAIYTVPAGKTAYVMYLLLIASDSNTAQIESQFRLNADDVTTPFSPFVVANELTEFAGVVTIKPTVVTKLVEKTDFKLRAKKITGGGSAQVGVVTQIIVIDN